MVRVLGSGNLLTLGQLYRADAFEIPDRRVRTPSFTLTPTQMTSYAAPTDTASKKSPQTV